MSKEKIFYRICFRDLEPGSGGEKKVMTLNVKNIDDSSLGPGFVKISDFIFSTPSSIVDPGEEKIRLRFEKVKAFHLSIYSIISVDEIGEENLGLKLTADKSNLFTFPRNPDH